MLCVVEQFRALHRLIAVFMHGYCFCDTYSLLDSPLFVQTRVLVTHGITYLPRVDRIVVLDGGRVSEIGTYEQLISRDGAFAEFIRTYLKDTADEEEDLDSDGEIRPLHRKIDDFLQKPPT